MSFSLSTLPLRDNNSSISRQQHHQKRRLIAKKGQQRKEQQDSKGVDLGATSSAIAPQELSLSPAAAAKTKIGDILASATRMGLNPSQRSSRRGKGDKSSQETSRRPVSKRPRRLVSTKRVKEVKMGACADPKRHKVARKMTSHFEIERDENEKGKEDGDGMQAEANKEKCQKGGGDKGDAKQEETGW